MRPFEKSTIFSTNSASRFSKSPNHRPEKNISKNEKKNEQKKKNNESLQENSFLSKGTSSKKKVLAIVTLNIEDKCEKLVVNEGQDLYEMAKKISKKYNLPKEFTNYITENIEKQIEFHNLSKRKPDVVAKTPTNQTKATTLTPKLNRMNNFNTNDLNSSKFLERNSKSSTRNHTTSPRKRENIDINEKKSGENSFRIENPQHKSPHRSNQTKSPDFFPQKTEKNNKILTKNDKKSVNTSNFFSTKSKLISSPPNESLNESKTTRFYGFLDKKKVLSPASSKETKSFKPTFLVGKDLKIIENNIIFLPPEYLPQKTKNYTKEINFSKDLPCKKIIFCEIKNFSQK